MVALIDDFAIPDGMATGCLPRGTVLGDEHSVFEEAIPLIPEEDWIDRIREREGMTGLDDLVTKIKNQRNEGSCASNAATQCEEIVRRIQRGLKHWVSISAMSLYKRVGSSAGSGSTIDGNLRELKARGALPSDTPENRERFRHVHPDTGFDIRLPDGWEETGVLFKAGEWFDIASWRGIITSAIRGWPICYGRKGHAICGVRAVIRNGVIVLKYANSWGNWGDNGFGYDSRQAVENAIRSYGAWALRTTDYLTVA